MDSTVLVTVAAGFFLLGIMVTAAVFSYRTERRPSQRDLIAPPGSGMIYSKSNTFSQRHWWADWAKGLSTEMGGAVITTVLLGFVLSQVQEQRAQEQHKAELIVQMGSPDNGFAIEAIRQLRALSWLEDGRLQNSSLAGANLAGTDLSRANLAGANLTRANLAGADLSRANLAGADLTEANLESATLDWADLENAILDEANLEGTIMYRVNFRGATLERANLAHAVFWEVSLENVSLRGANFEAAQISSVGFAETVILPDGNYWTPDTDAHRFNNSNHPDFWRSDDPYSPAYRGD